MGECNGGPSAAPWARWCGAALSGLALVAVATPSHAQDTAASEDASIAADAPVEIHGFVSQGFILGIQNEYLARSKRGSVEFSEAGINFTKPLTSNLRAGLQLFAHDLGPLGNYRTQFDWYYLAYHATDWLGVRVGRIKVPFGLYNELNDIDVARVPILLPQSIYQADHREYLFAQTGGEVYGDIALPGAGSLEYRVYGGTLSSDLPRTAPEGVTVADVRVPYLYGGRLLWYTPLEGLAAGMSGQGVRFDVDYRLDADYLAGLQAEGLVPPEQGAELPVKLRVIRWVASLQYAAYDWELSAEYSRWAGDIYSRTPEFLPPHLVNERYYVMASYRLSPWFTPGVYYSGFFANVDERKGHENYQHDVAATTRFDLNAHWLLKLEGHLMRGTAALDNPTLNGGANRADLEPTWGMLLAKTTAYF